MMEEEAKNKERLNQMTRISVYKGGMHDQINQFRNQDENFGLSSSGSRKKIQANNFSGGW